MHNALSLRTLYICASGFMWQLDIDGVAHFVMDSFNHLHADVS